MAEPHKSAKEEGVQVAHPRLILLTCILASSLAFIDGSVVNVGLPAIGRDLKGGPSDLQWIVNIYLLPLSALLLLGGALGDRLGRRRVLVIGTSLFALASIACALSPNLAWLLASRGLQGAGAALLMPNSLAILGASFQGEARGRAIGVWAAVGAMTSAVGPVIGGALIDSVGWRAIFYLNIPVALGAVALAMGVVGPGGERSQTPLDLGGAALATLGLGLFTWGLTIGAGPAGWTAGAYAGVCAGLAVMLAFIGLEHRLGERAMTPLSLFGSKSFIGLSLLTLMLYGALGGLLVLLPYVLIESSGYSATTAGAALLPFPLVMTVVSPFVGALVGKIGSRLPLTIGPLIVATGFLMALRIDGRGYWSSVLPSMLLISLGMSGAAAPLTNAVLASVDGRHTGSASGLNSALARSGGLIATAMLGGILAAKGADLVKGFHAAAVVGAVMAVGSALSAWLLLEPRCDRPPPED
jgi:EmrB/QacA subfamily drug resistance transporter